MPLADYYDMVKAFPPQRANHPLRISVLPWRAWRNDRLPDVQQPRSTRKSFAIDLIPVPDQIPPFPAKRGPTPSASTLPCPVQPETPAVPPHHGLGPHHLQRTPPILPESRQHDPEDPVHLRQPWPWLTRFPHGELLPQREILQRQLAACANRGAQCPKKDPKPSDHDRSRSEERRVGKECRARSGPDEYSTTARHAR